MIENFSCLIFEKFCPKIFKTIQLIKSWYSSKFFCLIIWDILSQNIQNNLAHKDLKLHKLLILPHHNVLIFVASNLEFGNIWTFWHKKLRMNTWCSSKIFLNFINISCLIFKDKISKYFQIKIFTGGKMS